MMKIGCCGFGMGRAKYLRTYSAVEVQQTFYQPPQLSTLKKWRIEAPPNFEFTIKAWQLITHEARSPTYRRLKRELSDAQRSECGAFRLTPIVEEAWATTIACAEALGATRILFQCPASFTPTDDHIHNMRKFFSSIKRMKGGQLYWEPRGDWSAAQIKLLCDELELWHVVDPFISQSVTPEHTYFRLHGRQGWHYVYNDPELVELGKMLPPHETAYVFFNNMRMNQDAARFQELWESAGM